jgi:hypothetical protein
MTLSVDINLFNVKTAAKKKEIKRFVTCREMQKGISAIFLPFSATMHDNCS